MPASPMPWPDAEHLPAGVGEALDASFFSRDTLSVARDLLGMLILSRAGGDLAGGWIVETEAYLGSDDAGSHASTKGVTERNSVMFGPAAHAYVYFTYGAHHMLNLVTEAEGIAGAVLIRSIEPAMGMDVMRRRRQGRSDLELTNGPGKLAAALGLDLSDNAGRLGEGNLAVFIGPKVARGEAATSGRIGLSRGHEFPYRYYVRSNPYVSKGRVGPARGRAQRDRAKGGTK